MSDQTGDADRPAFGLTFPQEETAFVKERYAEANAILEYGSGGSTILAAELGTPCHAVESDARWSLMLTESLGERFGGRSSAKVHYVDIGPTKEWGYPKNAQKWDQYWQYPLSVWNAPDLEQPDLVLIDGRMRAACFAAVLLNAKKKTTVLFDDYKQRTVYHGVERYVEPDLMVGRMAQFTVQPGMLTQDAFADVLPWFFSLR